jgi:hypothetical protein
MHPLNKNSFGNATGSIKVHYNAGSGAATGWIVKQPSATKWRIADSSTANTAVTDSNSFKCELEGVAPGSLATNQFTIQAYPLTAGSPGSAVYVARIDGHHVVCSDGNKYIWTLSDSVGPAATAASGYALLETN